MFDFHDLLHLHGVISSSYAVQVSNATSQGTLAAVKLLTALRGNAAAVLPLLVTSIGRFSLTGSELYDTLATASLQAEDCVTQQSKLMFTLVFAVPPSQSDLIVRNAIQSAIVAANKPLLVSSSAVNVGPGVYNITVVFPPNNQASTTSCLLIASTCCATTLTCVAGSAICLRLS